MMKCTIVFHSVSGSCLHIAEKVKELWLGMGDQANIYRVEDQDLERWAGEFSTTAIVYDRILKYPIARPDNLLDADLIILICPTYFGNMSGEMKVFLDSTAVFYADSLLSGKKLACISSSGSSEGGACQCLQSLICYGQHMGMQHIPAIINDYGKETNCSYGMIHHSGPDANRYPDKTFYMALKEYCEYIHKS